MAISEENIEHVESTGKNELGLDSNRTKNHDISTRQYNQYQHSEIKNLQSPLLTTNVEVTDAFFK